MFQHLSLKNRNPIPWTDVKTYITQDLDRKIVGVKSDGFCFLRSLKQCLITDCDKDFTLKQIGGMIYEEITKNSEHYLQFHPGNSKRDLMGEVNKYFIKKNYTNEVVDIVIGAASTAVDANLNIIHQEDSKVKILKYPHRVMSSSVPELYLLYHQPEETEVIDGQRVPRVNRTHASDHYEAVVKQAQKDVNETDQPTLPHVSINTPEKSSDTPTLTCTTLNSEFDVDPSEVEILKGMNCESITEKLVIDMSVFNGKKVEKVETVPYNINGVHIYEIPCTYNDWVKKQRDGRWWAMNTSTQRKSENVKKVGKCTGSWICRNNECPKYKSGKGRNEIAFKAIGSDLQECRSCGYIAERKFCGAKKMTVFLPVEKLLVVHYSGYHTCTLKERPIVDNLSKEEKKNIMRTILSENPRATIKKLQESTAEYFIKKGEPEKAILGIKLAQDRELVKELKNEFSLSSTEGDPNSFQAVADLRDELKPYDPFYIYKINNGSLNDQPSFVFKTSTYAGNMAIEMDYTDESNTSVLKEECVYVDAMHSRVEGYKTLTAWVYNPIVLKVMRLATMEVERENTESLVLFFRLFNEVLRKIKGQDDYKFNPCQFFVDEAGSNMNAIQRVFGSEALRRTVSCHFSLSTLREGQTGQDR